MTVADRIRHFRVEAGLTQDDLAKRCGYSHKSAVSRIESSGDNITLKQVVRIAKGLGTEPAILMGYSISNNESLDMLFEKLNDKGKAYIKDQFDFVFSKDKFYKK